MSLRDQMAADAEALFNLGEFAEEVTFAPEGGLPVPLTVIISCGADYGKTQGHVVSGHGVMMVKRSDFPDRKPAGAITRADGSAWTIGQEISSGPMTRKVEVRTRPRAAFRG